MILPTSVHTTTREDIQGAGYRCPVYSQQHPNPQGLPPECGVITAEDGWVVCEGCGKSIRLVWHVFIEEA